MSHFRNRWYRTQHYNARCAEPSRDGISGALISPSFGVISMAAA
jgi:hypothetical protein